MRQDIPVLGIAGWSGSGKTQLVTQLIPALSVRGLRVSTIKHAHHGFDPDTPGKDSYRHRQAGAQQVLVGSAQRWALMTELREAPEPCLADLLGHLDPVDLVLVEGFKREAIPKLEVWRSVVGKPALWESDASILAVASTDPKPQTCKAAWFHLDQIDTIADAVAAWREGVLQQKAGPWSS